MKRNLGQFSLLNIAELELVKGGTGGNGVIPPGKEKTTEAKVEKQKSVDAEGVLKPTNYIDKP